RVGADDDHGQADAEPGRRCDVVVEAAAVVPGDEDGGGVPVGPVHDRVHDLADPVVALHHREVVVLADVVLGGDDRKVGQAPGGGVGDNLGRRNHVRSL